MKKLGKVDLILVTHGHFDHIADAPALALMHKARVFAPGDLNQTLTVLHVLPPELLPRMNKGGAVTPFPDVLLIPIGGNFTMGPVDAAYATREWLKPKTVIPMHYGNNPLGKGTPQEFQQALGQAPVKMLALKPGDKAMF